MLTISRGQRIFEPLGLYSEEDSVGAELVFSAMDGNVRTFRSEEVAAKFLSVTALQDSGRAPERHTVIELVEDCFHGVDCAIGPHRPEPRQAAAW